MRIYHFTLIFAVFAVMMLSMAAFSIEEALDDLFLAQRTYFDALYEAAARDFGSMDGFIRSGLGITEAEREQLRKLYLTN